MVRKTLFSTADYRENKTRVCKLLPPWFVVRMKKTHKVHGSMLDLPCVFLPQSFFFEKLSYQVLECLTEIKEPLLAAMNLSSYLDKFFNVLLTTCIFLFPAFKITLGVSCHRPFSVASLTHAFRSERDISQQSISKCSINTWKDE